jgi:hypothetical protein
MRVAIAGVTDIHGRDEHLLATNLSVLVLPLETKEDDP